MCLFRFLSYLEEHLAHSRYLINIEYVTATAAVIDKKMDCL